MRQRVTDVKNISRIEIARRGSGAPNARSDFHAERKAESIRTDVGGGDYSSSRNTARHGAPSAPRTLIGKQINS